MADMNPLLATDPSGSHVVSASAGTGKTWLLVTRLLRLLLCGANPASILAITFTRKAAGEMQTRLYDKLRQLACCADAELDGILREHGIASTDELRQRVRTLYQGLLLSGWQPRVTTFHSFCQTLLQRFPLEADIPPGFELTESGEDLLEEALTVLFDEAGTDHSAPLYQHLFALLDHCGGLPSLRQSLRTFIANRPDWWAWTEDRSAPAQWAADALNGWLNIVNGPEPVQTFVDGHRAGLQAMADGLVRHSRPQLCSLGDTLHDLLSRQPLPPADETLALLNGVFLISNGDPRKWPAPAKSHKLLGQNEWQDLEELIKRLAAAWADTLDTLRRLRLRDMLNDWYFCGDALLDVVQRIKTERRQLDFTDLEWKAYRLLNDSDHAHWVQYKLDQKIDHILVDEFQDTNPTQWRLLYPLLQEFAAGDDPDRNRSVFLVGDPKQSIYGFRRADPRLFRTATDFMTDSLGADVFTQSTSRRSAPAIIDFVNTICLHDRVFSRLPGFEAHATVHAGAPGHVELLPLPTPPEPAADQHPAGLRRPLRQPTPADADSLHDQEARLVSRRTRELLEAGVAIGDKPPYRPLRCSDILILVPNRTHVGAIETALREAGIPFLGTNRGTLMECQEVRDIVALLQFLSTPFDNVALATVLRSPLFGWSHEQIADLADSHRDEDNWYRRLLLASATPTDPHIARAVALLQSWLSLSGLLPVHDLLDRICFDTDIRNAYRRRLPPSLQHRALSNIDRLIDLSLEMDAGRYPSLHRFLDYLHTLAARDKEAPDEGQTQAEDRVRIMTIHGSKGLEAPVVFLAGCGNVGKTARAWESLTDWPAGQPRPQLVAFVPRKEDRPRPILELLEERRQWDECENMNLLYVALTRARQYLFISAAEAKEGSWYQLMARILEENGRFDDYRPAEPAVLPVAGARDTSAAAGEAQLRPAVVWQDIQLPQQRRVTPSQEDDVDITGANAADRLAGQQRGTAIHRLLELLSGGHCTAQQALDRLLASPELCSDKAQAKTWLAEAEALLANPSLRDIFDATQYHQARNEVPILARADDGSSLYGIIDRLLVSEQRVLVIDYKTHRYLHRDELPALAEHYRRQMACYHQAVAAMYPQLPVQACLLFTQHGDLVDMTPGGGVA